MANCLYVLLVLCWVVPEHFPPWTAFHTEAPGFAAALLALLVCWRWSKGVIQIPAAIYFLLALVFSAVVQWATGTLVYGGDAVVASIYLLTLASAWLWGYQWVRIGQEGVLLERVSIVFVCIGLLAVFQVIAQWLQVEAWFGGWVVNGISNGRPRANIGQPNQAATTLLMGTMGAAVLVLRQRIGKTVAWVAVLIFGVGIVLTQSRTALVSTGLAATIFVAASTGTANKRHDVAVLSRADVFLWVGFLCSLTLIFQNIPRDIATRDIVIGGAGIDQMVTLGSRPLIWKQLIAGLLQSPWLGYGWLQIPAAQHAGALMVPGIEQTNYAHNVLLDIFVMLGIPLGLVVLGVMVRWCWLRVPAILRSSNASAAIFLLIPFLVHSLLEYPHAYSYFLVAAGVLCGAIDAWTTGPLMRLRSVRGGVFAGVALIWGALLLATGYEYTLAEEDFRISRFESRAIGETAVNYTPPRLYLLTQLGGTLQAIRLRAKPEMEPEELDALVKFSHRYSWAPMQYKTALALALNNKSQEASRQFQVIKGLYAADVYAEMKSDFLRLQAEKYKELAAVILP